MDPFPVEDLGDCLSDIKYGTSKKSHYDIEGVPVLRIPNIDTEKGHLDLKDLKFSELESKEFNKLRLKVGDILIIRSNGSVSLVGQSAIVSEKEADMAYAGYLVRLRTDQKLLAPYLNYSLSSGFLRSQIVEVARSTSGVNNINTSEIKALQIPVPTIQEQQEIVKRVEGLFAVADKIEAQYNSLKTKIDTLPQAILNKAFKGELVPQNPNDEPASVLLERINGIKTGSKKAAKAYKEKETEVPLAAEGKEEYK